MVVYLLVMARDGENRMQLVTLYHREPTKIVMDGNTQYAIRNTQHAIWNEMYTFFFGIQVLEEEHLLHITFSDKAILF